jgi:transitional endoplasmic reticulum ATPase
MGCDLLGFARTGAATATVLGPEEEQIYTTSFRPPARRYDFTGGAFIEQIRLMSFSYKFGDAQFLLYVVEGRDGDMSYPVVMNNFILSSKGSLKAVHGLIEAVTRWGMALHEEVLVFDQGM